ncbi:MAG TPA: hypothetical protein VNA25_24890 [Phycisphaerae bacterium]|nr:hypothetical protein [Phycisphaerae bacterium]
MMAAIGDLFAWWELPLLIMLLGVSIFGSGALLYVGGRFLAKLPKVTFWRAVWTNFVAGLAATLASVALSSLGGLAPALGGLAGVSVGFVISWVVIMAMFRTTLPKAMLAWVPTLGANVFSVALLVSILMPGLSRARELAKRASCATNLSNIGKGVAMYQLSYEDAFPPTLEHLIADGQAPGIMRCPSADGKRQYDYFYLPPEPNADSSAATGSIIACDYRDNHKAEGRNVLFADLHIGWLREADFQEFMKEPANAAFATALPKAEGP